MSLFSQVTFRQNEHIFGNALLMLVFVWQFGHVHLPFKGTSILATARDNNGVLFTVIPVGKCVSELALLVGREIFFWTELFRPEGLEESTRQSQPRPNMLKESFVI